MEKTDQIPKYILDLAREFRQKPTMTENFLWHCIRDRQIKGYKFRRQHPIGRYIADFYCHEASLVVELDGKYHSVEDQKEYDKARDEELTLRGLRILHVPSKEVVLNPEKVLIDIINLLP
ncbi:MAG: endonuclease domain-containing protein [Nitrospirota bacterium]